MRAFGLRLAGTAVGLLQPAARGDSVGLVLELVGPQLVEGLQVAE